MTIAKGHPMKICRNVLGFLCLMGLWLGLVLQVQAQTRTVHLYYTDPQGTVLAKTDAQGNILAQYDYTPYGNTVASLGSPPDGPGYTGHVNDPETGLVYMQARYYQPIGRFPSPDPVGPVPGNIYSFNRYAYANNNPIVNTDPTGAFPGDKDDCSGSAFPCFVSTSGENGGGGNASHQENESTTNIPSGTPDGLKHYFVGITASDRIKAAMAVMNYYGIGFNGVDVFYSASLSDRADTLKAGPSGDGQLTIGPNLFKISFGYIGSVLSHEIEGHWDLQWSKPGMPAQDTQSIYMREVQAYRLQLSQPNIRRFGLSPSEVNEEKGMLDRYYNALSPGNKDMVNRGIYKQL